MLSYKTIKTLFFLFLLTLAVYLLNSLFVFYTDLKLSDHLPPGFGEDVKAPKTVAKKHPFAHYDRVLERNLFAVTVDENRESSADLASRLDELSLTSLNCTLIGTVTKETGPSWAIIKDNQSNKEEKYTVGSAIRGAKVKMILRNKVVLNIEGKDELLVMGIEKIKADRSDERGPEQGATGGEVSTYKLSKDFVQESINNVAQIMANVRITPHLEDGQPKGFQIRRMKQESIFKTMGFRDGDIIQKVNGQEIHSAEDIMGLYGSLKDANFFSIDILRKGKARTLNFKVR